MKVLFDTNILIDFFLKREPFTVEARELLESSVNGLLEGFVTANTISDIFYLIRKKLSYADTRKCLINLMELLTILSITEADCLEAIKSDNQDFEDVLMEICAHKAGINYIVTRDIRFMELCSIAISPAKLLKLLK